MELLRLELINYRRLFERTVINFAQGDKNVTIIRAENGSGKTGILMALLFGLFGTVKYEQFQIENDSDFMVSSYLLEKSGSQATCTVIVDFLEDGHKYQIKRSVTATNTNGVRRQSSDVDTSLLEDGVNTGWDKAKIDNFMNNIIGENIRGFLFFDGVKYTDLFKQNDTRTRKELQKIIEKMLNINDLDQTIATLNAVASSIGQNSSNGRLESDYAKAKNTLGEKKTAWDDASTALEKKNDEITEFERKQQESLSKLAGLKEYEDTIKKIKDNRNRLEILKNSESTYVSLLKNSTKTMLKNTIYKTFGWDVIDDMSAIAQDSQGSLQLLETIVRRNQCICSDHPLSSEEKERVQKYIESIKADQQYHYSLSSSFRYDVTQIQDAEDVTSFDDAMAAAEKYYNDFNDINQEYNSLLASLPEDINLEEVTDSVIESSSNVKSFEQLIERAKGELPTLKQNVKDAEAAYNEAKSKVEQLDREKASASGQQMKFDFIKGASKKLAELKKRYLIEAQQSISNRANEFFLSLISDADKQLVSKMILDEDYTIKVFDKNNVEIFGQLSAGQKLMASMAFVMGLTAEASDAKPTCNFPLVMDTPMSNLDSRNRGSLISLMPTVVKQWILTPMDTELTDTEIDKFIATGKVGNVYQLLKTNISSKVVHYNSLNEIKGGIRHA
jgi:DNA sulfur modification protein DndD